MSDTVVKPDENLDDVTGSEEEEHSPTEVKAMDQGWRPQEEWEGDPDGWVDAKEFVFRGELMSRIQNQSNQLKSSDKQIGELKGAIKQLGDMNQKIAEKEYDRALKALRREKSEALSNDEHDVVMEIDDRIDDLKESKKELKENPVVKEEKSNEPDPAFQAWVAQPENGWYMNDPVLRGAADAIGIEYVGANPNASWDTVLSHVSKQIRIEMPHKFRNTKRDAASVTEGSSSKGKGKGKSKFSAKDLTEQQRNTAKIFIETGALESVQAYVDQLVDIGELG